MKQPHAGRIDATTAEVDASPRTIRLEIMKLVFRHDKDTTTLVARASELERYVRNGAEDQKSPQT